MADHRDLNGNSKNNTPYIIGALLVLALIAFMFMRNNDAEDVSHTAPAAGEISSDIPASQSGSTQ